MRVRLVTAARVCVTNLVPDLRSCTVHGQHLAHCDGHARRWNARTERLDILDSECRGCVPRPAEAGYLCYDHLVKFDNAVEEATELVAFIWEDGGNGVRDANDGGSAGAGPRWPLTEARIRAEWIAAALDNTARTYWLDDVDLTYLDARNLIPTGSTAAYAAAVVRELATNVSAARDELIAKPRGAEAAVRATAVIQAGYRLFPLVEAEHRVGGVRCPNCQQARLIWSPPLMHRDDVTIKCDACGHIERQEWLEQYAAVMQLRPVRVQR